MKNEDLVLLLARYLVENNDLDYLILNVELTEETSKVLYHFLNLVGKYDIYDENKEEVIGFEVASKVTKFYLSFKNIIANKISDARKSGGPKLEEGFISREDFFVIALANKLSGPKISNKLGTEIGPISGLAW